MRYVRWGGAAAMLGGFLWSLSAVLHSMEPQDCMESACSVRPIREASDLLDLMTPTAALLLLPAIVGLLVRVRHEGRLGRAGAVGGIVGMAGLAVLLFAAIVTAVNLGEDLPWMPIVIVPGLLATVVGFLLVGIAILRSGLLPRRSGVLLIVGSLILLAAKEQTAAVLFAVPFGLAWMVVGYLMWSWKVPSTRKLPAIDSTA